MDDATRKAVEEQSFAYYDPTKYDNAMDTMPNMEQKNGLKLYDLVRLPTMMKSGISFWIR